MQFLRKIGQIIGCSPFEVGNPLGEIPDLPLSIFCTCVGLQYCFVLKLREVLSRYTCVIPSVGMDVDL